MVVDETRNHEVLSYLGCVGVIFREPVIFKCYIIADADSQHIRMIL